MRRGNWVAVLVGVIVAAVFVIPTTANVAYPNKLDDCSRCHGPSQGTYYDNTMSVAVSKTTLAPGEAYIVGIDIVIQTSLSKKDTGYAIEDLGTGTWVAWLDSTAVQSHYDQTMTAPAAAGTYNYRVWGESGPATSDGKTDYDDYTITVQPPQTNGPPTVSQMSNKLGNAGTTMSFAASATDPDLDSLRYTWSFGDGTPFAVGNPVSHTFAKASMYTFVVYVDDLHGHNVSTSATASAAFTLNLVAGWNLVGAPVVGFGYRASNLGLQPGDVVVGYSSATSAYNRSYTVGSSPAFKDFWILPNEGYWIFAGGARVLSLQGLMPTAVQTRSVTVPSLGGWTIFSLASQSTAFKASNVPSWYTGGTVTVVAGYDPATLLYKTWTPGSPAFKDFGLVPGLAYWIYVGASGTMSYAP